jgi:dihydrofolate synthase/folylpolyglutamate synthase
MHAYEQLYRRTAEGIQPGLEVIEALLAALDHPERQIATIHIAGTNGKGSVAAMIEAVLRASGLKTGLYTSPHLIHFSERYRINGAPVSNARLQRMILAMETFADEVCATQQIRRATFFELATLIGFHYFAQEEVDVAIIETGMGGRWDATNVIYPLCSVITHIDMDHTEFLGETLSEIAAEKAGIIKEGRPVISAPQSPEAEAVLRAHTSNIMFSKDHVSVMRQGDRVKLETHNESYPPIALPLLGDHQVENMAVAVCALEVISERVHLPLVIKKGLEKVCWPGRFMRLSTEPEILYDGAHNVAAARALIAALQSYYAGWQIGFVLGFLKDKDVNGYLKIIGKHAAKSWGVSLYAHRGAQAEEVQQMARTEGLEVVPLELSAAWQEACTWAGQAEQRVIVVAGSLHLAEALVEEQLVEASSFFVMG